MVFVGHGSAEQREDAVAGGLHDVAVVAMRGVDHQLQRRIDHAASVFGVKVLHQLGRALDIGEQRGDGLALALQHCCVIGFRTVTGDLDGPGLIVAGVSAVVHWPQNLNPEDSRNGI